MAMGRGPDVLSTTRAIGRHAQNRQITFLAASIAYYAFVSIIPALLLAIAIASIIGGQTLVDRVLSVGGTYLTPAGQDLLGAALQNASGRTGATVVGTVALLWSTLKVFRGIDIAISQIYGVDGPTRFLSHLRDTLVVGASITAGGGGMVVVGAVLAATEFGGISGVLGVSVLLVGLTVVFLPVYVVFPDADIGLREALPGAALAAVGWVVLQVGFQVYAVAAPRYALYGVIGGVLLLVTWYYFAAVVLLLGAVVNHVLSGRMDTANRQVQHGRTRDERTTAMDERDGDPTESPIDSDGHQADTEDIDARLRDVREDLNAVERALEERTVRKSEMEAELKRYVRRRLRRGHARGWGPYLVLLYGTAMTLAAFYFLGGGWAILAMIIIWLSTLGLYVTMVLLGAGVSALGYPTRAIDAIRDRRS